MAKSFALQYMEIFMVTWNGINENLWCVTGEKKPFVFILINDNRNKLTDNKFNTNSIKKAKGKESAEANVEN